MKRRKRQTDDVSNRNKDEIRIQTTYFSDDCSHFLMFSFEPFFFFVSMIWLAGVAKQMNECKMTIEYFGSPKYVSFIRLFRLCQVFCCGDDLIFFFYYFPCTEFDSLKTGNTSDK